MKKLVLGAALVVAATSVGCTTSDGGSDEVAVPVSWKFTELSTNSTLGCPSGFGTAVIKSQPIDDVTHLGIGQPFTDQFNCSDLHGTIGLPDGDVYLIWVEITSNSGGTLYAQSQETLYDTLTDTGVVDAEIIDDGGFFFLEWDLYDATNRLSSCQTEGSSFVEINATVADGSGLETTTFDCADHYGTTRPLPEGTYTVGVEALDSTRAQIGKADELIDRDIVAPGGYTGLGLVKVRIDP